MSHDYSLKYCKKITKEHYENFPVASFLLPKKLRAPIMAIYAYARYADDIVDSCKLSIDKKTYLINHLENIIKNLTNLSNFEINNLIKNNSELSFLSHLKDCALDYKIDLNLLLDLLIAFKQDITKTSYKNSQEILDYCKNSANPIGRLLLDLNNIKNNKTLKASDDICTALQIINFMQDIKSDYIERNRCYIPEDILNKYNLKPSDIISEKPHLNWIDARNSQLKIAKNLILKSEKELIKSLKGRFKLEIKLIISCAKYLINKFNKIKFTQDNIFERPKISKLEYFVILKYFF